MLNLQDELISQAKESIRRLKGSFNLIIAFVLTVLVLLILSQARVVRTIKQAEDLKQPSTGIDWAPLEEYYNKVYYKALVHDYIDESSPGDMFAFRVVEPVEFFLSNSYQYWNYELNDVLGPEYQDSIDLMTEYADSLIPDDTAGSYEQYLFEHKKFLRWQTEIAYGGRRGSYSMLDRSSIRFDRLTKPSLDCLIKVYRLSGNLKSEREQWKWNCESATTLKEIIDFLIYAVHQKHETISEDMYVLDELENAVYSLNALCEKTDASDVFMTFDEFQFKSTDEVPKLDPTNLETMQTYLDSEEFESISALKDRLYQVLGQIHEDGPSVEIPILEITVPPREFLLVFGCLNLVAALYLFWLLMKVENLLERSYKANPVNLSIINAIARSISIGHGPPGLTATLHGIVLGAPAVIGLIVALFLRHYGDKANHLLTGEALTEGMGANAIEIGLVFAVLILAAVFSAKLYNVLSKESIRTRSDA